MLLTMPPTRLRAFPRNTLGVAGCSGTSSTVVILNVYSLPASFSVGSVTSVSLLALSLSCSRARSGPPWLIFIVTVLESDSVELRSSGTGMGVPGEGEGEWTWGFRMDDE